MRLSALLLPLSLSVATVHAQFEQLQKLLNPIPKEAREPLVPEPGIVYPIDADNYRDVLQHNNLDWLVLFTTGPEQCPGCVMFDKIFNESVALLQDNKNIYFARVDCDAEPVVCSLFGAWGSRVIHISHSDAPSKAFPGMTEHSTHIHTVPFHRPGTENQPPPVDSNGEPIKGAKPPPPPPDAKWIAEVVNEKKWKKFEEWSGSSHPFDGSMQQLLYVWWSIVAVFSKVPPMAMMIGIGLLSRFVTGRFSGRVMARREQAQAQAAAAAKKTK